MRQPFTPGYRGFLSLCDALGVELADFQRLSARATFEDEQEVCVCAPRGSAKTTTVALLALHHLASRPDASVFVGAGSRQQARILGGIVNRYALHPALADHLLVRTDQVRGADGRLLQIVSADGAKAHGWERPTMLLGDEVWSWGSREPTLLGAMVTSLIKNPSARLVLISTAPATPDSPLGKLRRRALSLPLGPARRGAHRRSRQRAAVDRVVAP